MKKGGKWWLFNHRHVPPSCDELAQYFDNYDDIIDHLNDTGELISTVPTIADSSDDSLEAFCRRYHAGGTFFGGPPLVAVEREQYEKAVRRQAEWREYEAGKRREYEAGKRRAAPPHLAQPAAPRPPKYTLSPIAIAGLQRLQAAAPLPPPRRPAINPFAEVQRRKLLIPILEKTRRIREELRRRHDAGAEEYLF